MTPNSKTMMEPLKKKTRRYENIVRQIVGKIERGKAIMPGGRLGRRSRPTIP
ncbi:MAG: hypothetical protein LBU64_07635 [Planctomycetota bacterium]|jgi:hypothetical protein|nr:hypothetical protein [Planctomycetota bacterium]